MRHTDDQARRVGKAIREVAEACTRLNLIQTWTGIGTIRSIITLAIDSEGRFTQAAASPLGPMCWREGDAISCKAVTHADHHVHYLWLFLHNQLLTRGVCNMCEIDAELQYTSCVRW